MKSFLNKHLFVFLFAFFANIALLQGQNPFPATVITSNASTSVFANAQNAFHTNVCITGNQDLHGQCTWYVAGRIKELSSGGYLTSASVATVSNALCNGPAPRHAKYWDNIVGGTWHNTTTNALPNSLRNPGMIVMWDYGTYGHVAFAEEINSTKTHYRVSEFNWSVPLGYSSSTWLPFEGDDMRGTGVYPKFYVLPLTSTSTSCPTPTSSQLSATATSSSITATSTYNTSGTTLRQFGYRQYGTSAWNNLSSTSSTSQTISGLLSSTTYEINQRAYCNGVWTAWSNPITKTTLSSGGASCGTPTGVSTSSTTSSTCTLSWNAVSGASYYTLWYLSGSSWVNFGSNISGTSVGVTGLAASTQYCFAVKAVCGTTTSVQSASVCVTTLSSGGTGGGITTGGCTGGSQYPTNTLYPNSSWQTATCLYAGEYALVYVTSGTTYTFTLCSTDGGSASFDSELTLLNGSTLAQVHYADDVCGDDAKLTWTANFTGNLRVLVNAYHCSTNTICTNLVYKMGTGKTDDTEVIETDNIEVFPNPASTEVTISFEGDFDNITASAITIYNISGQVVAQQSVVPIEGKTKAIIDVTNLPNGTYIVQLSSANGNPQTAKLVIAK